MNDGKKESQKAAGIKIKHLVGLKQGRPVQVSLECGEVLVRLEGLSRLSKRAVVSIETVGQPALACATPANLAPLAVARRLHKRLYTASPN